MALDLKELSDLVPVGDIAKQLGIDEAVAEAAVQQVLPGLVSGLAANAQDPKGAASLEKAVTKHRGGAKKKVKEIDTEDGKKIVRHIFGPNEEQVADKLAAKASSSAASNVTSDIIKQILPIVAPIVLAWLADKFLGGKAEPKKQEKASDGGIGDLLGGLLGGGSSGGSTGGDLLGGILGGLLGGGRK